MATGEQIKRAILKVAGNPSSGVIPALVDEMVAAIVALDDEATRETRVIKAAELR